MVLATYRHKRDFTKTPEPKGRSHQHEKFRFYIQKHAASHLHYDFRLELKGVLKSWAVPKGPSLDPDNKRLAIQVEDHPIEYGKFEGIIPKGEYGGGTVMLWDEGTWEPLDKDPDKAYKKGHLRFELHAKKLHGRWDLIRFKKEENSWFLIKFNDDYVHSEPFDITEEKPHSVLSEKTIEELSDNYQAIWTKKGLKKVSQKKKNLPSSPPLQKLKLSKSPMPNWISPQLATLVDKPPQGKNWLHEVKFDGYRMLAFKMKNKVKLMSRNKKEWTDHFHNIADAIKKIPVQQAIFDGEIVLLDKQTRSNFQLLQNSFKEKSNASFIYYIFDMLYYEKWDIRTLPLLERKMLLESLLPSSASSPLRFSDHIIGSGWETFKRSCEFALEGIMSKENNSPYLSKRSTSWLKIKCLKRQEFVIGGFTQPKNSRNYFGSLFLGVFDPKGNFVFCGNVGTGFTQDSLKKIYSLLKKRITKENPFNSHPPRFKSATWVKPELIAEIEFTEWTSDGRLRHPSFKGLRHDKKAKEVIKESELSIGTVKQILKRKKAGDFYHVELTHPDKILYKEDKISKQDIFNYYKEISPFILPYISQRPLTLVRCPNQYKDCFYQKKLNETSPGFLHPIEITNNKGTESDNYIYIEDEAGLLSLIQLGVLEIHPWGSHIETLEYPDLITLDLDPSPGVQWKSIVNAAFEIKNYLEHLQLKSFVKTSGGKGLHVVLPIKPNHDWEYVKNFTRIFVQFLEKNNPDKYTSTMSKEKRKGKIFIDYLRNQRGATAIAPYSTRARIHAPVATPLDWDELTSKRNDTYFTITTLPKRLKKLTQDPWKKFLTTQQSLKLNELESRTN